MRASSPRNASVLSSGIAASIGATSVATAERPLAFSRSRTVFRYCRVDSFTRGVVPGSPPLDGQVPNAAGVVGTGIVSVPPVPEPPPADPAVPERAVPAPLMPPLPEPAVPVTAPLPLLPGPLSPISPWQAIRPDAAPNTATANILRWLFRRGAG